MVAVLEGRQNEVTRAGTKFSPHSSIGMFATDGSPISTMESTAATLWHRGGEALGTFALKAACEGVSVGPVTRGRLLDTTEYEQP